MRAVLVALFASAVALCCPAASSAALTLVTQWGSGGAGNGQFAVPQGVAVDGAGNVYVADQNNDRVEKFDSSGTFLLAFGGPGQLNGPAHLSLDPQGNVLVADEGNYRILKYSPTGQQITQYGRFGSNPGQFSGNPRGVAADGAGNVYAISAGGGGQVLEFAPDGTFIRSWGVNGTGPGQWQNPAGLAIDGSGHIYVGDRGNVRVDVFNLDGTFVRSFGTASVGPSQLGSPNQMALDSSGNAFVADPNAGGLVEFDSAGNPVGRTTDTGSGSDPFKPFGVAVGPGDDVFATDVAKSRVLRFRQGVPPPVQGKTVDVSTDSGTVLVKVPGGGSPRAGAGAAAAGGFVPLSKLGGQVPVGSTLDTTHGTVHLLSAANSAGAVQDGHFSKGLFIVSQATTNPLTTLQMTGGNLNACHTKVPSGGAARVNAARRRGRSLFANVHGHFATRGRNSTATVRGTQFLVKDTCAGTLTQVQRGVVTVRDFSLRKTVKVKAHHKYLARPPKRH